MTNEAVQALIAELGERICIIVFDNNSKVYIGYPSSTLKSVSELKFKTFGGVDMIGIPKAVNNPQISRLGVTTTTWHATECIQAIATMDEGFEIYRIDPLEIG